VNVLDHMSGFSNNLWSQKNVMRM